LTLLRLLNAGDLFAPTLRCICGNLRTTGLSKPTSVPTVKSPARLAPTSTAAVGGMDGDEGMSLKRGVTNTTFHSKNIANNLKKNIEKSQVPKRTEPPPSFCPS
jgi:hypothetical protein